MIVFIFFEQNFAQTLRLYPKVLTHTTLIETFALFTFSILFSTDTVSKHHNHCNLSLKSTKYIRQHSLGLQGPYKGSCAKDKWLRGQSARQSGQHGPQSIHCPAEAHCYHETTTFPSQSYIYFTYYQAFSTFHAPRQPKSLELQNTIYIHPAIDPPEHKMSMTKFPHHPSNHPSSPEGADSTETHHLPTTPSPRNPSPAALQTLMQKLTSAQTTISESQSRPQLSERELTTPLPLKISKRRHRPPPLILHPHPHHQAPSEDLEAQIDSLSLSLSLSHPQPQSHNPFLRCWHSIGELEKWILGVVVLCCGLAVIVVPFLVRGVRRGG